MIVTEASYVKLPELLDPFAQGNLSGYQWLYDLTDEKTSSEFLFLTTHGCQRVCLLC